ncbi:hypothetical protein PG984_012983 [Apiospora sp. TS-2023a]
MANASSPSAQELQLLAYQQPPIKPAGNAKGLIGLSYAIAIGFVKSSICVALLRLTNERCYRIPLWLVTLSAVVVGVSGVTTMLTLCRPIAANWNKGLGSCSAAQIIPKLVYMINVMAIITDLVCVILPWFILRKLQMPKRTKYSILFVLRIGILASIGSVMRVPYTSAYLAKEDILCEQLAQDVPAQLGYN